jgi:hypothetical protein
MSNIGFVVGEEGLGVFVAGAGGASDGELLWPADVAELLVVVFELVYADFAGHLHDAERQTECLSNLPSELSAGDVDRDIDLLRQVIYGLNAPQYQDEEQRSRSS